MYDKNPHTNVWQKRIQMYEKNTHTKTHTNVWQKHAYKHVYKCMKKTPKNVWKKTGIKIYWSGGQPITAPREYGMPCSRAPQPWQGGELPHVQLSAHKSFCWAVSGDWTANPLVMGRPHSPLRHRQPKYKCKNVWQKHAYKCMKKTQKCMKKQVYKCMKKTGTFHTLKTAC